MARVTLVNTDPEFMDVLMEIVEEMPGVEGTAIDGERPDVVEAITDSQPDVLVIDLWMGDDPLGGWAIAQKARAVAGFQSVPVLICTADVRALEDATAGVNTTKNVAALSKPFDIANLTAAIERLLPASSAH